MKHDPRTCENSVPCFDCRLVEFNEIKNKNEIANIVYDTLMKNDQHETLNLDEVENQEIDCNTGIITFSYKGFDVEIKTISKQHD